MKLDRWGRDGRRAAGTRAAWFLRAAVLAGVTGVAWLAGVAAAHADQVAGSAQDDENASGLAPMSTSMVDAVAAESEQAALAPVSQLESTAASILAVPGALLNTSSEFTAAPANHDAIGSADAIASDIDKNVPLARATDDPSTSAGVGSTETEFRPLRAALEGADPVMDSLVDVTRTFVNPLTAAGPFHGRSDSVANPLAVLNALTYPAAATAGQVGTVLAPAASISDVSDVPLEVPIEATGDHPKKRGGTVRSETDQYPNGVGSAESSGSDAVGSRSERLDRIVDVDRRSDPAEPVRTARYPDPGIAATGGSPYSGWSGGCSPYDSAAGRCALDPADRNAQVSRVTPLTAVFGQLPDHVEDPAVSPD